jgi:hypothetical protein
MDPLSGCTQQMTTGAQTVTILLPDFGRLERLSVALSFARCGDVLRRLEEVTRLAHHLHSLAREA